MQILFLVSAHNSLSQRAWIALTDLGHEVAVAVVDSAAEMETAVRVHAPDLVVCPFLKTLIPESIWRRHRCLIVHPGPRGDRGPSSLDWAIELGKPDWGVTVLQAIEDVDAGEVWATCKFGMRKAAKSSLYRHEVRRAAIEAVLDAIDRLVLVGEAPPATTDAGESGAGAMPAADGPGGSRDRLAVRPDRACSAEGARGRRSPRRARRNRRHPLSPVRGAPGADAARPARRTHRAA